MIVIYISATDKFIEVIIIQEIKEILETANMAKHIPVVFTSEHDSNQLRFNFLFFIVRQLGLPFLENEIKTLSIPDVNGLTNTPIGSITFSLYG